MVALDLEGAVVEHELVLRGIGRVVARGDAERVPSQPGPLRGQRQRVGARAVLQRLPRVSAQRAPRQERRLGDRDPAQRRQVVVRAEVPGRAGGRAGPAVGVARPLESPTEAVRVEIRVVAVDLLAEGPVAPGAHARAVLARHERRQELGRDRVRVRVGLGQVPARSERRPGGERDVAREVVLERRRRPEARAAVERRHVDLVAGCRGHRVPAQDRDSGLVAGSRRLAVDAGVGEVVAQPQVLDARGADRRDVVEGLDERAGVLAGWIAVAVPDARVAVDIDRADPPVVGVVGEHERRRERSVDRRPAAADFRALREVDG